MLGKSSDQGICHVAEEVLPINSKSKPHKLSCRTKRIQTLSKLHLIALLICFVTILSIQSCRWLGDRPIVSCRLSHFQCHNGIDSRETIHTGPSIAPSSWRSLSKYDPPNLQDRNNFSIYVVSPPTATHRRRHAASQLHSHNITSYQWFDTDTDDALIKFCQYDDSNNHSTSSTATWEAIECSTHLRLMHRMVSDVNIQVQLVLSDDIIINTAGNGSSFLDTLESIMKELPYNWELLRLHTENGEKNTNTAAVIDMPRGDGSLRAVTYTRQFAAKVLTEVYQMYTSTNETPLVLDFSSFITRVATQHHQDRDDDDSEYVPPPRTAATTTTLFALTPNIIEVQHVFPVAILADDHIEHHETKREKEEEMKKKSHVVIAVTGDVSQVPNWMLHFQETENVAANWDIIALFYGDNPYYDCPQCIAIQRQQGAKFNLIYQFMQTPLWKDTLRHQYSSMMIADDDLIMDVHSLNIAFEIFTRYNLTLAQQSVCKVDNSYTIWDPLYQEKENALRYVNWVEIMAPIFKADFFNKEVNYTLQHAFSGFGLDSVWPSLLGYPKDKIAIIDAVCMAHPREPLLSMSGRKIIYGEGVMPFPELTEEEVTLKSYGLTKSQVVGKVSVYNTVDMRTFLSAGPRMNGKHKQQEEKELYQSSELYYSLHRHPAGLDQLDLIASPPPEEEERKEPASPLSWFSALHHPSKVVVVAVSVLVIAVVLTLKHSSSEYGGSQGKIGGKKDRRRDVGSASSIISSWMANSNGNGNCNSSDHLATRRSDSANEMDLRCV